MVNFIKTLMSYTHCENEPFTFAFLCLTLAFCIVVICSKKVRKIFFC